MVPSVRSSLLLCVFFSTFALTATAQEAEETANGPADELAEEPSAGLAAEPDSSIDLYFERCSIEPDDKSRQRAQTDWQMLLNMGYEASHLVQTVAALPEDCSYISLKSAVLATGKKPATGTSGGGGGGSLGNSLDREKDEYFAAAQAASVSGLVWAGGIGGYVLVSGAMGDAYIADDMFASELMPGARAARNHLFVTSALSWSRLVPHIITLDGLSKARTQQDLDRAVAAPYLIAGGLDIGVALFSILSIVELHALDQLAGVDDFPTSGGWITRTRISCTVVAIGAGLNGVLQLILGFMSLDELATAHREDTTAQANRVRFHANLSPDHVGFTLRF